MIDIYQTEFRRADLNLMVVFAAIMRERSVTRAAAELHVSQAAVSAALGRLRRMFDDPLFVRAPGGMAPTARAADIARRIEPALRSLYDVIVGSTEFDPDQSIRTFALGMSDDVEAHLMPRLVRALQADHPGLSLIARQANRHVISHMLDQGEIDLGISVAPVLGPYHQQEPLFESGYLCVFDGERLTVDLPISLEDYLAHPHVLISFDGRRGIVDDLLDAQGLTRNVLTATTHFAGAIVMLKSVNAIATLPAHAATAFAEAAGLTLSPPPIAMPAFVVSLVWHTARSGEPALTWLRNRIHASVH
jgi:LysR family transcriptional activator of mexEF-oprN operon